VYGAHLHNGADCHLFPTGTGRPVRGSVWQQEDGDGWISVNASRVVDKPGTRSPQLSPPILPPLCWHVTVGCELKCPIERNQPHRRSAHSNGARRRQRRRSESRCRLARLRE
jgi:hypothetical protein